MPNYNQVILIGNVCADPELRYLQNGTPTTNFNLAVNEHFTTKNGEKKKETLFIRVVVWNKLAELVTEYCKKGSPVLVSGKLKANEWTTKEGEKKKSIEVIANKIQFLDTTRKESADSKTEHTEEPSAEQEDKEEIPF